MERNTYIYLITHIDNDPYKVYIGKTINIHSRKLKHYKSFGKNILFNIIDESLSLRKYWEPLESYWIEQFKQWGFDVINKNKKAAGFIWKKKGDTNFNYNFSTHKSKNTKKPEGFGKKPEGFGNRISQSLLLFYKRH
jgi:hypothetical protein